MTEKDAIITYETLYEILRLEKSRKELQRLDDNFFMNVVKYLEEKKSILHSQENKDSIFAQQNIEKTRKQLENVQKIFRELYEKRESKILQLALFCSRTNNKLQDTSMLLEEEKLLYTLLLEQLTAFRTGIQDRLIEGKKPQITLVGNHETPQEKKNKLVRFVQAVPQFVAEDMNTYGPFEAEDVAHLPIRVSEVLIKNKRAEEI
ncbi:MAG: hypothetical protein WC595_01850 [Candidatus Nanoarchaeia archaeon]